LAGSCALPGPCAAARTSSSTASLERRGGDRGDGGSTGGGTIMRQATAWLELVEARDVAPGNGMAGACRSPRRRSSKLSREYMAGPYVDQKPFSFFFGPARAASPAVVACRGPPRAPPMPQAAWLVAPGRGTRGGAVMRARGCRRGVHGLASVSFSSRTAGSNSDLARRLRGDVCAVFLPCSCAPTPHTIIYA